MKIKKFLILALAGTFFFTSCETDDEVENIPEETGAYAGGVFVLNEGNFNAGNASVSYINPSVLAVTNNIFAKENDGAALGDVGQSMAFYEDYALIVLNVSGTVEIVDRLTFESVGTIDSQLSNPRYIAFSGSKAYITNWGDGTNPDDDYVLVVNMDDFGIERKIPVAEGPEKIISEGGKLYVAHKGGYGFNNIISVISSSTGNVDHTITVGDQPNSMQVDAGFLWVASSGLPSYAEEEKAGSISKINLSTNEVVASLPFPEATDHPANLELDNGSLYYTLGREVFRMSSSAAGLPDSALMEFEDDGILYGFEVINSNILGAFANADYTGNGSLLIYNLQGGLIRSFDVGINPNGIYLNVENEE